MRVNIPIFFYRMIDWIKVPSPFQKSPFFVCANSNFVTRFLTIGLTQMQSEVYDFVANFLFFQKQGGHFK